MAKKWVWHYQLTDRHEKGHSWQPVVDGRIVLPTPCGATAIAVLQTKYDENFYVTFLNLEGECDE